MELRRYDSEKDREAAHRIWREVGWLEDKTEMMDLVLEAGRAMVAEVNGSAECLVLTAPGTMRYLDEDLPFTCLTGVTTSRIARKQGLAKRLAAHAIAFDAVEGALVAGLGMFEQGYYDQIGFGTGSYAPWVSFDPALLNVAIKPRVPRRLTTGDWAIAHQARLERVRTHGNLNLTPPAVTRSEMLWTDNGFGLGYTDGPDGRLSHYMWCKAKHVERGPYSIRWMVFQTGEQFLELMALLKSLGDQVRMVNMDEPPGIQLQDLLDQPFKQRQISAKSSYATGIRCEAWWQVRICDLAECLARTHLWGDTVRFNLRLSDPITAYLDETAPWRGVGGDYVVTLGPSSGAEPGSDAALPTMTATVNAITRLWLGVRPAAGLAVTGGLSAPPELLAQLDRLLHLPTPRVDWGF